MPQTIHFLWPTFNANLLLQVWHHTICIRLHSHHSYTDMQAHLPPFKTFTEASEMTHSLTRLPIHRLNWKKAIHLFWRRLKYKCGCKISCDRQRLLSPLLSNPWSCSFSVMINTCYQFPLKHTLTWFASIGRSEWETVFLSRTPARSRPGFSSSPFWPDLPACVRPPGRSAAAGSAQVTRDLPLTTWLGSSCVKWLQVSVDRRQ